MIEQELKDKIDQWANVGHPDIMGRFLLKHGREFKAAVWPYKRGKMKECFKNATDRMYRAQRWTYCEGLALNKDIGMLFHHAWLTDLHRVFAFDPTVENPLNYEYFGIPFDNAFVNKTLARTGVYGLLDTGMIDLETMRQFDPEFDADFEQWKLETGKTRDEMRAKMKALGVEEGFSL